MSKVRVLLREFPLWLSRSKPKPQVSMRMQVQSLASLSGLRIGVAVAVVSASSCGFNSTPGLGTSICRRCGS